MIIKTTKSKLFYDWLTWLSPVVPLAEDARLLLSGVLTLHYQYTKKDYNPDNLNTLLFDPEVQASIAKKLDLSPERYQKANFELLAKGLIQDNELHPMLTNYPKDDKFKIYIDFKVDGQDSNKKTPLSKSE